MYGKVFEVEDLSWTPCFISRLNQSICFKLESKVQLLTVTTSIQNLISMLSVSWFKSPFKTNIQEDGL